MKANYINQFQREAVSGYTPHCTCDIDMNMFIPGCPVHDPQNTGVPPKHLSEQQSEWSKDYSGPTGEDEEMEREAEEYANHWFTDEKSKAIASNAYYTFASTHSKNN